MNPLKYCLTLLAPALLLAGCVSGQNSDRSVSLFNGKNLDGWTANEHPETFSVKDGELVVKGDRAHLFYTGKVNGGNFTNFVLKLEIMTKPKANSGVYFHTAFQKDGWPAKGYEIQVNNSHTDPKRTAGLYGIDDNYDAVAKDNEWFTMEIMVQGKHIVTKVNDKVIKDYVEPVGKPRPAGFLGRLIDHGTFAIQGHDPGSESHYRKIEVKVLP
jgi:hypothetical protein